MVCIQGGTCVPIGYRGTIRVMDYAAQSASIEFDLEHPQFGSLDGRVARRRGYVLPISALRILLPTEDASSCPFPVGTRVSIQISPRLVHAAPLLSSIPSGSLGVVRCILPKKIAHSVYTSWVGVEFDEVFEFSFLFFSVPSLAFIDFIACLTGWSNSTFSLF